MTTMTAVEEFLAAAAPFLAGAFTWTFLEYVIHRFLGHSASMRKNPFAVEHIRHHSQGDYFAPGWKKAGAALVAAVLLGVPAVWLVGQVLGVAYVAGLIGFYGVYELVHRLQHVTGGFGPYGRWLRRHHFTHHFVDPACNHGVTSPIWDVLFGTYRKAGTIRVPAKLCMRWLTDPATGQVRSQWANAYVLAGTR